MTKELGRPRRIVGAMQICIVVGEEEREICSRLGVNCGISAFVREAIRDADRKAVDPKIWEEIADLRAQLIQEKDIASRIREEVIEYKKSGANQDFSMWMASDLEAEDEALKAEQSQESINKKKEKERDLRLLYI